MRRSATQKDQSRARILDAAQRRFREDGIEASGLAGIMSEAGLTLGGFYAHFASKDDLVATALDAALVSQLENLRTNSNGVDLAIVIKSYLSGKHRDSAGDGCPSAALLPELSRQSEKARQIYASRVRAILGAISHLLSPDRREDGADVAIGLFGMLIGCMQMARAVADPELSDRILEGGVRAAVTLAGIQHPGGVSGEGQD
jgi:AcrR family transcriptional regulator